jgi:hypothetical protein
MSKDGLIKKIREISRLADEAGAAGKRKTSIRPEKMLCLIQPPRN